MSFEKREIVLIIGILFLMIGLLTLIAPIYAIAIAIAIYLGIRVFVIRKKQQMQKSIGAGICAVCGEKILENKCPKCNKVNNA